MSSRTAAFVSSALLALSLVGCGQGDDAVDGSEDALKEKAKATATDTQTLSCKGATVDDNGYPSGEMAVNVTIADPRAETLTKLTQAEATKRISVSFTSDYEIKLSGAEIPKDSDKYLAINGYTSHSHFAIWIPVTALGKADDAVKDVSGYWNMQGPSLDARFTCESTLEKKR